MYGLPKSSKIPESGEEMSKFREYELWYFNLVFSYGYCWLVHSPDLYSKSVPPCWEGLLSQPPHVIGGSTENFTLARGVCSLLEDFEGKTETIPKFFFC